MTKKRNGKDRLGYDGIAKTVRLRKESAIPRYIFRARLTAYAENGGDCDSTGLTVGAVDRAGRRFSSPAGLEIAKHKLRSVQNAVIEKADKVAVVAVAR